jgi:hypothetical protein
MTTVATLTLEEYDERKRFFDDLKTLVKSEQEGIFQILRAGKADFSENSNGIFFDVTKVERGIFRQMKEYMDFCKKNRDEFNQREEEERTIQEELGIGADQA